MKARLIYHSVIRADDTIETLVFPGERGAPSLVCPRPLPDYSQSQNLSRDRILALAGWQDVELPADARKRVLLETLERARQEQSWSDEEVADMLAEALYAHKLEDHRSWLPLEIQ